MSKVIKIFVVSFIISTIIVTSIILYNVYLKPRKSRQPSSPAPYQPPEPPVSPEPPVYENCSNSLKWNPLCFIQYVINLNIDWQLYPNLETFQLIQNKIKDSGYTPKDLLGTFTDKIEKFNTEVITAASQSEKSQKTIIFSLTNWGPGDENKMFFIIFIIEYLLTRKGIEEVRDEFIKNIDQNFIDCMYSIFSTKKGPSDSVNINMDDPNDPIRSCIEKILPKS
jgi:hypothetical protein